MKIEFITIRKFAQPGLKTIEYKLCMQYTFNDEIIVFHDQNLLDEPLQYLWRWLF